MLTVVPRATTIGFINEYFYTLNNWEGLPGYILGEKNSHASASALHYARLPYKIIAHDIKMLIKCHHYGHSSAILTFSGKKYFKLKYMYCKIEHSIYMWPHTKTWIKCHQNLDFLPSFQKYRTYTFQYL